MSVATQNATNTTRLRSRQPTDYNSCHSYINIIYINKIIIVERDMKRDKIPAKPVKKRRDDGEQVMLMEPMQVSEQNPHLAEIDEMVFELNGKANRLAGQLPAPVVSAIGDLVRSMNCYYSNLIEGHDTHPIDIERALRNDYSKEPKKRDLQREAVAHIKVQKWIDASDEASGLGLVALEQRIHRDFYAALPEELHWVQDPKGEIRERVIPGAWRQNHAKVGQHVTISPGAVSRFMTRWEEVYPRRHRNALVRSLGPMHHRFAWIHPHADGNGRTGRLVSHAILKEVGVGNPLWAVSRGLARKEERYKQLMEACDEPRRGDMDGRGSRSESALVNFSKFFLECCIDQVDFMNRLIQPATLNERILRHVRELVGSKALDKRTEVLMRAALQDGKIERADLPGILGEERRTANRIVKGLVEHDMLDAESHRAPLHLKFSAVNVERWLPGLYVPGAAAF